VGDCRFDVAIFQGLGSVQSLKSLNQAVKTNGSTRLNPVSYSPSETALKGMANEDEVLVCQETKK
jgi:hypothetical protein